MTTDFLDPARDALASGRPEVAVHLAWKAVRPAVLAQDPELLTSAIHLADEIAGASDGAVREEAEQLSAYCTACILEPRDTVPSAWTWKRFLSRRTPDRKKCPDCAEEIAIDARVCRFCGYRYAAPPTA